MQRSIYLDYAATTPVDHRVVEQMKACLDFAGNFGNAASRSHIYGWQAEEAVEQARAQVAELIGADTREIVWTSGATESDNLAIKGVAQAKRREHAKRGHIITSAIEHKAVLDTCAFLEDEGFSVTYLKPDEQGIISPEQLKSALRDETILVSLMHVNNEIGTLTDVAKMGEICRACGVIFHVDAAQSAARLAIDVNALNVDLLSMSAHKMYGPKGIGALFVRRSPALTVDSQIHGGGHERGMRSGTLATHQIAGFGMAAEILSQQGDADSQHNRLVTQRFLAGIQNMAGVDVNGSLHQCVDGIVNLCFGGIDGESILIALKDLAISTGSACTSASLDPSYVLTAMGQKRDIAQSALRFSFGRYTTEQDIDTALAAIEQAVSRLKLSA